MSQPLAPGAFAKALQDRRDSVRRRRLLIGGIAGGALALTALLVYLLGFSPLFSTGKVEVNGTSLLSVEQVSAAAAVPMGEPLLPTDTDAIAERVATLAPVLEVHVARALPDTIVINVTERTLVYQLKGKDSVDWVDAQGVVFNTSPAGSDGIVQVDADEPDARLRTDIATVVANLPPAVDGEIESFTAEAVDRIGFGLTGDREVVWGSAEESELKSEVLAALLSVEAEVYDVSAPRNPITRK